MAKTLSKKKNNKNIEKKQFKNPHKSFRRTYREDYKRETNVPGMFYHILFSFRIFFKHYRLFLPLLILAVVLNIALVGIMSEATYMQFQDVINQAGAKVAGGEAGTIAKAGLILASTITTGGLSGRSTDAVMVFGAIVFLILWLTTIFILRHKMAEHDIKLRDALYNAMTPLVSSFVVFIIAVVECAPVFLLIIAYSAAVQTDFLAMPFYALLFLGFAILMILISGYLLSSTLMALVAVSAPGLYPIQAMRATFELMRGRRISFIARLIALIVTVGVVWGIVMVPLILFDFWMKNFEWAKGIPFVPVCLNIMACFTVIYGAIYLYIYYIWLLEQGEEEDE